MEASIAFAYPLSRDMKYRCRKVVLLQGNGESLRPLTNEEVLEEIKVVRREMEGKRGR